ncbi:GntR family transcriptional regulator [Reyranella sp.]|uniref:GntR family transcriptional regulator n=1 Tax=Reyranella sp. TaxID=1929291 RepID=UPI003BA8BF29
MARKSNGSTTAGRSGRRAASGRTGYTDGVSAVAGAGPSEIAPIRAEAGGFEFLPRYARVAQSLIEDIAAGKHPVGTLIDTEAELCDRFGISRNTARSALAVLNDMGLVSRHAGIGTVVRSLHASPRYVQEAESVSALFPNLENSEQQTLSETMVKADGSLARLLDCRRGESWKRVESLRSIRKHRIAVAYSNLYLPQDLAPLSRHLDRLRAPAYTIINQHSAFRIARLVQETSACPVPAAAARRLGVADDSPGLQVIRRYVAEDARTLLVSETIYPAGRYSFSFAISLPRS